MKPNANNLFSPTKQGYFRTLAYQIPKLLRYLPNIRTLPVLTGQVSDIFKVIK
jgi:hypothetical protein